jgi:AbrB family looped-hinge helix DNA binding protein
MNMDLATTTMSRNGQVVIPLSLRKAMGLGNKDRFLVVGDGDTIVLKRLTKDRVRQEFEALLTYFSDASAKAGLTPDEAEKEIQAYRAEKRRKNEGRG